MAHFEMTLMNKIMKVSKYLVNSIHEYNYILIILCTVLKNLAYPFDIGFFIKFLYLSKCCMNSGHKIMDPSLTILLNAIKA